ncbi:MAG: DMT family transporter [Pseudomonadota bacterium]
MLPHSAMTLSKTTTAIIYSLLALLLFDLMALIIKYLSPSYTAAELSAYRNLFGLIPAALVLWRSKAWHANGRPIWIRQWRLAIFRGIVLTVAQFSFYLSLGLLSFATASTITYANALFLVALAVPLLHEKVGGIRWGAVILGFIGVVLVMGPGRETFSTAALLPLLAAFCYALVGVTARLIDPQVPTPLINLISSTVAAIGAVTLTMFLDGFTRLAALTDLFWIFAMGAFGGSAVLFLVSAYRMTDQSNLAPFSYFGIPLAFLLGWIFYDEAPWSELFPGALLIIAGGLLIIWRERRQKAA